MKAVIVAAGRGSRLSTHTDCKPLTPLLGRPLIEHVVTSIVDARERCPIDQIVVVSGWMADKLEAFIETLDERTALPVSVVHNEQWEAGNGMSVLSARAYVEGPFFLFMADHIIAPEIIHRLADHTTPSSGVVLATDFNLQNPLVDLEDVTRVLCDERKLTNIGKQIVEFNAFDTGCFLATPDLFEALQQSEAKLGTCGISDGVRYLAKQDRAWVVDIGDSVWVDVDTPQMLQLAEQALGASPSG